MKKKTIDIQKELIKKGGKVKKYQDLILGRKNILLLLKYELITSFTQSLPGAVGLWLRSKLYPKLLGLVGDNVTFGSGIVIRHPHKIFIGDNVVIDDNCVLDAKGSDNRGIFIGDGVFIGRNTVFNCQNGDIILDNGVNIGSNCMIFSASRVNVGEKNLLAAYCYLVGGTHNFHDPRLPVLDQGRSSQGIEIGPGGWLGAHVTVFDGVRLGKNVVVGAGSVVSRKLPDYCIAGGNPVTIINRRKVEEVPSIKKKVTVGIINYNNENVICETIESVLKQNYNAIDEMVIVDNCSTDNSINLVRKKYPDLRILTTRSNRGPNPARNKILKESDSELVLLIDGDIVLSENTVSELTDAFRLYPDAGIVTAQIRSYEDHTHIQYNGSNIHFVGGAIANPYELEKPFRVGASPGGIMMIDRKKAEKIGYFDEDFIFGWEDGDFSFRMTICGYLCLVVSKAHVYHRREKKGIRWVTYQVRNRIWFILKNYNWRTIIILLPAIIFYQIWVFGFFLIRRKAFEYLKGIFSICKGLPDILKKRQKIMKIKSRPDKRTLQGKGINMVGEAGDKLYVRIAMKLLNMIMKIYWLGAKWLIK